MKRWISGPNHELMRALQALILSAAVLLAGGCAQYPENARLKHYSSAASMAGASGTSPQVKFYLIDVSLDALRDETERRYVSQLPTSFKLPPGAVARLRADAATLLNQSETYRALLLDLGSDSRQPERASR
jgi:hypothetical protein